MPLKHLLVFSDDWGRHPSSCQHLIKRFEDDHKVLWVNTIGTRQVKANSFTFKRVIEKLTNWTGGINKVSENMWVVDVPMLPVTGSWFTRFCNGILVKNRLKKVMRKIGMNEPTVLTTLPYIPWLIKGIDCSGLIYYCTDDFRYWPSADGETLRQADLEITKSADMVLAVSNALLESHNANESCSYFPHGVDVEHFAKASDPATQVPEELSVLNKPAIGFFGLIYEKLDFDLLISVAQTYPEASLVMIGPVDFCADELKNLPNVHLLGAKDYSELPNYLKGFDVVLMPYRADDEMIRQSNPLKLRECIATGKPVVSVDVPENRKYSHCIQIAEDREAFVKEVGIALTANQDASFSTQQIKHVENESWEKKSVILKSHISTLSNSN